MLYTFEGSATKIERLLGENEHINECYKDCKLKVISKGDIKEVINKCDVLVTELRILFIVNSEYNAFNLKVPTKFSDCRFIYISNIVVNAIYTPESDSDEGEYFYIQLGGVDVEETFDDDYDDNDNFELIEINIIPNSLKDKNIIHSMFNFISETVAYNEQLENKEVDSLSAGEELFDMNYLSQS
ncbi:hypothetical protein FG379_002126 [Cryptosporidium bovis]|uniref:uncharacterized protein n=1 Tax=Cryptosporidium bovis TaxID=310047 RepID=UPI00351A7D82|nr:hypothetical protein FG379_002126 [Cryptosporidium bovis]